MRVSENTVCVEQRTAVDRNQWIRMHAIAGDALNGEALRVSDMGPPAAVRRRRSASLLLENEFVRQLGCCHVLDKQSCRSTRFVGPRNIRAVEDCAHIRLNRMSLYSEALDAKDENVARIASVKKPCDMAMTNKLHGTGENNVYTDGLCYPRRQAHARHSIGGRAGNHQKYGRL
jgi:hypothetical protein